MNKERRAAIAEACKLLDKLEELRDELRASVESIRDEEQDYYDNMPESFQNGDKGDRAQEAVSNLDNAYSDLDNIDFDEMRNYLDTAAE